MLDAARFGLLHACGEDVRAGRTDAGAVLGILTVTIRELFVGVS